jgi:hypothetical protein
MNNLPPREPPSSVTIQCHLATQTKDYKMSSRRITCASLSSTDGTTTYYAIYRATLHFDLKGREPFIDLNRNTVHVDTIKKENQDWHNDELTERYLDMARPYSTAAAPAFSFTDCIRCHGTDPDCRCKARNPNLIETRSPVNEEELYA